MTAPTREQVLQWMLEAGYDGAVQFEHFAALAFAAGSRSGEDARDAARWREIEARMVHHRCGPNIGWTLPDLLPGDSPEDAIDAAMGGK